MIIMAKAIERRLTSLAKLRKIKLAGHKEQYDPSGLS